MLQLNNNQENCVVHAECQNRCPYEIRQLLILRKKYRASKLLSGKMTNKSVHFFFFSLNGRGNTTAKQTDEGAN